MGEGWKNKALGLAGAGRAQTRATEDLGGDPDSPGAIWGRLSTAGTPILGLWQSLRLVAPEVTHWKGPGSRRRTSVTPQGGDRQQCRD